MRVKNETCYVMHSVPFSESSLIVNFFTKNVGRVNVLAKGARRIKSPFRGLIRPFVLLNASWSGKGNVPVLRELSIQSQIHQYSENSYYCCTYLNELINRLLADRDPHPELFDLYQLTLNELTENSADPSVLLRIFEKHLLKILGYEMVLDRESDRKTPISDSQYYLYDFQNGPIRAEENNPSAISGKTLLAIANERIVTPEAKSESRRLLKHALNHHLEGRRIHSREIYSQSIRMRKFDLFAEP